MHRARRVRLVGGALPLQVGHDDEPVRSGRGGQREPGQLRVVHAQQRCRGVEDPCRVERAHQRQVLSRGRREPGHRARGVCGGGRAHRAHHPGGADRDDDVTARRPQTQCGTGVVTGTRSDQHARGGTARGFVRREHPRQPDVVAAERQPQQVTAVLPGDRGPVARPAGVAAVGDEIGDVPGAEQLPGQPVVRQAHRRRPLGVRRLVLGEPAQLGDRDGGHRDRADGIRPHLRAELSHQLCRGGRRAGVVPQQRRPHHLSHLVEAHHAVLLSRHGHRGHVVQPARGRHRRRQGVPPRGRVDLGADGVRRPAGADLCAGVGVAHHDLGALGRRVDARDQDPAGAGHAQRAPSRCSRASWVSRTNP